MQIFLYNNTDHPTIAVIYDLLQRILQLHLALLCHLGDFRLDPVLHNLLNGFSENIGLPDPVIPILCIFLYVGNQILRLLLVPYNRGNLRLNMGLDQVDGGHLRLHFYAIFISMPDHLRLIQHDF